MVFVASQEWSAKDRPALNVARLIPEVVEEDLEGGGHFWFSRKGAALRVDCPNPIKRDDYLYAVPRISGPQDPEVEDVKAFTRNYAKGIAKSKQCNKSAR